MVACLESTNYVQIRNALIILTKVNYYILNIVCSKLSQLTM